jgi:quercetin dioxygenase-like cupin family protein
MKHEHLTDEIRETTALHALGALGQEEAQAFAEHLKEGCKLCTEELRACEWVVSQLGCNVPSVQPRPAVRARLFANLAAETVPAAGAEQPTPSPNSDLSQFQFLRSSKGHWQEFGSGVSVKILSIDPTKKRSTALVRMAAGTRLPKHRHLATEEVYVLEGDCHVAPGQVLRAGDYFRAEEGSVHEVTFTEAGTTFLTVSWNEFLS